MPRLSLYKPERANDYKFHDKRIYEMFTVGGTDIVVHKYLGTSNEQAGDATQPVYDTLSEKNIQDLLFLENRDRVYERDVYTMRGIYNVQDIDFDLSQFGLFLSGDTLFITFHLNNMVERLGRKLMSGDVLELPHLKDFYGLDETLDGALKRYYVVQEGSRAAEGFSPTWYAHLWRVKCTPLVDAQEYKDIFDQSTDSNNPANDNGGLRDLLSTYKKTLEINDAIIQQAEAETPTSGYDTSPFYIVGTREDGSPADPFGETADDTDNKASTDLLDASEAPETPRADYQGHLVGDGQPPNGLPVTAAVSFPGDALEGDYVLRLDYMPNRLFRYDGSRWARIEDNVQTNLTRGAENNQTQKESFISNDHVVELQDGTEIASKQGLSDLFKPEADN
jgi:hypothetical protein